MVELGADGEREVGRFIKTHQKDPSVHFYHIEHPVYMVLVDLEV